MIPFEQMIKIVGRWTVTCEFEYIGSDYPVAASSDSEIKPLLKVDGTVDQLALSEYEDFVINLLGVFDRADFEVIDERHSPYSCSYYFDLVKKDQENKKDYKYILFIRISDHLLSKDREKYRNDWFNSRAQQLKEPKSKSKQVWKLKQIVVNKDTYYSYDEALDELEKRFESMQ